MDYPLMCKILRNLDLFKQLSLIYEHNNINTRLFAFVNQDYLNECKISGRSSWCVLKCDGFLDQIEGLVLVFGVEKGLIVMHNEYIDSLGIKKTDYVNLRNLTEVGIREYDKNSNLNYFPNLVICEKISIVTIRNNNQNLVQQDLIPLLIKQPFVARLGQQFSLNFIDNNVEQLGKLYSTDKFRKIKKIQYALQNKQSSLLFLYKELIHFQVEQIVFRQPLNPNILVTIQADQFFSKKFLDYYFIVNIAQGTEVTIQQNYQINRPLFFPIEKNAERQNQYKFYKSLLFVQPYKKLVNSLAEPIRLWGINSLQTFKTVLLIGQKGIGKRLMLRKIAEKYKLNYKEKDIAKTSSMKHLEQCKEKVINLRPCLAHFRNLKSMVHIIQNKTQEDPQKSLIKHLKGFLNAFKETPKLLNDQQQCLLVCSLDKFSETDTGDNELKNLFDYVVQFPKLSDEQTEYLLIEILEFQKLQSQEVFQQNSKLKEDIFRAIKGLSKGKIQKTLVKSIVLENNVANVKLTLENLLQNLEKLKKSNEIDNLSIPNVLWDDVGGLQDAKDDIIDTIMLPQKYPEIFDEFVRPRTGLLFFGPPGTGKTLLAKCIANECKMNFLSVKGPELLNMYIGESEKNVREIFFKANRNKPCVIFFDELDALAPRRGQGQDSNQVMDRIVAQFLTEMDEVNKAGQIYVIGATNRPDLLDQSFLRSGRFDKMIYLGISEDEKSRINILQAQTRKLNLDENVNFLELEKKIFKNFTGADFYGLTSASVLIAARKKIEEIDKLYEQECKEKVNYSFNNFVENRLKENPQLGKIIITQQDFEQALEKAVPSVSQQELERFIDLQKTYSK